VSTSVKFFYYQAQSWLNRSGCFPGKGGLTAGHPSFAERLWLIVKDLQVMTEPLSMVRNQYIISRRNLMTFQHHYPALILEREGKRSEAMSSRLSDLKTCGMGSQRLMQNKMSHCLTDQKKMTFLPVPC
jgi:hypothetical protein